MWLFFFLLFPKKPVLPVLDSLLTNGMSLSDNLLLPTNFSFYHIINFFILLSISYKIFSSIYIEFTYLSKRLFLMFSTIFSTSIIATLYYNLFLSKSLSTNYLAQFDHLLHLYEGLIFSIVIFLGIRRKEDYYIIFKLFLLTVFVTCAEFFIARYTDFLPGAIKYFSLNYRGAFRSVIHSGSLASGMILFYGLLGLLGLVKRNKYILLFFPIIALSVFNTYERSSILLLIISSVIFLFFQFRQYLSFNRIMTALVILFLTVNILPKDIFSRFNDTFNESFNTNIVDGSLIKGEGWFNFSSSKDRSAARKRGMDVFYFSPFFGAGPGNLEKMMTSNIVPMKANLSIMEDAEFQFYNKIATAYHPTDPHNFYVRVIAEYGIFGLIFLLMFFYIIIFNASTAHKVTGINSIGYCGIYSIIGYGFFQTFPISYPMIILFLSMITFKNQSLE
tara:strand:+ start:2076 stop:3416 length:1341 start_codon:yes stop_codon:yes gene_type:complete